MVLLLKFSGIELSINRVCFRENAGSRMAGPTPVEATDSESFAFLRDPECGIPFDVHFDIEDTEGTSQGMVGGHKTIMALKSPVFKAMLFGPLAETGDLVKIKNTSMFAFKRMLNYMHDAERDWRPWSIEIRDLFLIADLAERYTLPGLTKETIDYAKVYIFPKERLIETFRLAEDYHVFEELSEAVLARCAEFLMAILETAEDLNNFLKEWSGKDGEDALAALRLLARVDHQQMAYSRDSYQTYNSPEVISHLRNLEFSIQPRYRLQQLKALLDETLGSDIMEDICSIDGGEDFTSSLKICQMKDKEKAALEGTPLTMETIVEDGFTHERASGFTWRSLL